MSSTTSEMDVWEALDHCAEVEPACSDRVSALKAFREQDPEQAEYLANQALRAIWAALEDHDA